MALAISNLAAGWSIAADEELGNVLGGEGGAPGGVVKRVGRGIAKESWAFVSGGVVAQKRGAAGSHGGILIRGHGQGDNPAIHDGGPLRDIRREEAREIFAVLLLGQTHAERRSSHSSRLAVRAI